MRKLMSRFQNPFDPYPGLSDLAREVRRSHEPLGFRLIAESLIMGVQYVVGAAVEGDIVEFGTHSGRTARMISMAMKHYQTEKSLHLFDSFEGMPESQNPVDLDNAHVKSGVWGKGQLRGISPEELRKGCAKFIKPEAIKIYKGWFSDTLSKIPRGTRFGMIHVDSDLYSSAFEVLDYLFRTGAVSEGALLFFDDWNCNRASNNHGERKAWKEIIDLYAVSCEDMGGYGWAAHKFVVHSYSARTA